MSGLSPEFLAAGRKYKELFEAGKELTPEGADAFNRMYETAPESFRQEMHSMAVEMGLLPDTPDGYSDSGEPVYQLAGIAKRLGVTEAEVRKVAKEAGITPSSDPHINAVN